MKNFIRAVLWGLFFAPTVLSAQSGSDPIINSTLDGQVLEAKSKSPVQGATVQIKGTTHKVLTDEKGKFNFRTGQKFPYILQVSFVGYQSVELPVNGTPVEIQLSEQPSTLNEVVVVGYGTQRRSELTGSVASVSKQALAQPVASLDNLVQGSVPGVAVTQSSGQPGSSATIRVRGGNSITFGNDPLYVIDGFIVYNNNGLTNTAASNGAGINALSTINPSDIESMEVLKDASATAIYGSRGANGVVIITTRRGRKGATDISYNSYVGRQQVGRTLSLLNATQWASLVNDINRSEGKAATFSDSALAALGAGSDWQRSALRDATLQNHELSFSGGDEKSRYLISGNYFDQGGTVLNTGFRRYSARINYDRNLTDRLRVAANVLGSQSVEDKLFGSVYGSASFSGAYPSLLLTTPVARIKNNDGNYNTANPYSSTPTNPLQDIAATTNRSHLTRLLGSASAEYRLLKSLVLKVTAGADLLQTRQNYYAPSFTAAPAGSSNGYAAGGYASVGNIAAVNWLNENTLTWDKTFGSEHALNLLGGYTTQSSRDAVTVATAQKFPNDLTRFDNLNFAATAVLPSSDAHQSALNSYLARVNYSFRRKYNLTLSGRADGSSRLGAENRWGFFPSIGFSWNAHQEDFLSALDGTVSNLKLRLSAGRTGNSEVPPYSSLAALTPTNYYFNSTLVTGIAPAQITNPELKWETTTQYNAGADLALWNGRVSLVFDAYYKKTSDLLLNVPLPLYTGYVSALENVGSVENKGIELALNTENWKTDKGSWKSTIVFAANRNKVLSLGAGTGYFFPLAATGQVSPVIVQVGAPVGTFWGYTTAGLLTASDLAKGVPLLAGVSQQEGDRKYVDFNGDGVITTADKHNLGSSQPRFTFGFSNTLTWQNFDLSFLLQGNYGNKIFNLFQQKIEIPTLTLNVSSTLLDRWSASNPKGTLPRATNSPVPQVIDRYIEDGSYVKLKNISLGYSLPRSVFSKIGAKGLRVYVSGQNLLTFTHYTGYDPEVNFYDGDNTKQGIDYGIYPSTRTLLAGLKLTF